MQFLLPNTQVPTYWVLGPSGPLDETYAGPRDKGVDDLAGFAVQDLGVQGLGFFFVFVFWLLGLICRDFGCRVNIDILNKKGLDPKPIGECLILRAACVQRRQCLEGLALVNPCRAVGMLL